MKNTFPYCSVLEDLEWLWDEWWNGDPDQLTDGHIRRGSAALRLLLVDGLLGKAWRNLGFKSEPVLYAPNLEALVSYHDLRLDLAVSCIAGGGRQRGVDMSFLGAFRVDNPATGMLADAEEGFAVCTTLVARMASENPPITELNPLIEHRWTISNYLKSAGAIRKGVIISRQEVIEYFRNYAGGTHHYLLGGTPKKKTTSYEIISDLSGRVDADIRDGLYFELLSIGQTVARSNDVRTLVEAIRKVKLDSSKDNSSSL